MTSLTKTLKQARIEKQLKQAELGAKLGLPQSHISTIENGGTDPRISTLTDIARFLDRELILVPKNLLPAVMSLINAEDSQKPLWSLDDSNNDEIDTQNSGNSNE